MLFRKKEDPSVLNIDHNKGSLHIKNGSEVEKQISMIGLSHSDLQVIHAIQPFVIDQIEDIVDGFYKTLENEPSLLRIINDNSSIDRLKKTLRQHIIEMFDGVVDETFFAKRIKIAQIHVRIGLQTKWYMCAFQDLLLSLMDIIETNIPNRKECFLTLRAVSKCISSSLLF